MTIAFRTWPVCIFLAAALLFRVHDSRAQTPASAEPATLMDVYQQTREARIAGDNKAWLERGQRLLQLAPEHPDFLISVARALAANGRVEDATAHVANAVRRGAGFDLAKLPELASMPDSAPLRELRRQALQNLASDIPPDTFMVLPNASLQPEGITWDPLGRHLYIGSLDGAIWRVELNGKLKRFAGPDSGLREVLGLKVDAKRRLLWAVTGVFPEDEPRKDMGTTGVHAYRLDTGERVRECGLDERPTLHGFNDMALASDGTVYVSDSVTNSIYKLSGSECQLDRFLHDPAMTFPNGMVLTSDGSQLYVGHVEGISVIDVRTAERTRLPVPADASVNSIDGLVWDGKDLLGIQNNPYLSRVIRVRLTDDARSIRQVTTMSSRPPQDLILTTGVIVGDQFFLAAGASAASAASGQPQPHWRILRARLR